MGGKRAAKRRPAGILRRPDDHACFTRVKSGLNAYIRCLLNAALCSFAPSTACPTYVDTGTTSTPMTIGTPGVLVIMTVILPLLLKLVLVLVQLSLFDE